MISVVEKLYALMITRGLINKQIECTMTVLNCLLMYRMLPTYVIYILENVYIIGLLSS